MTDDAGGMVATDMSMLDSTIVQAIKANGLLREGHFAYRSGQHSGWLVDRDRLLTEPEFASHLGYALARHFFTDKIDTVATPSIWGAGVAQWIAYFLEPRARIVHATPLDGKLIVAPVLEELIRGKRVLLCDNLIMTGSTMQRFSKSIADLGGRIIGIATIWNSGADEIGGFPVYGLLNTLYDSMHPDECTLCAANVPIEQVPY
jgi:orotate phosphoribosyltransferase